MGEEGRIASRRRSQALQKMKVSNHAWGRAFEAVILFYETMGDEDMAEMLRLDLDRFDRMSEEERKLEWEKMKAEDGAA